MSRNVGGETLLVPIRSRAVDLDRVFLHSNKVGTFLWSLLDGTRSREQLCHALQDRFAVPDQRDLGSDVDRFLAALTARGLLQ